MISNIFLFRVHICYRTSQWRRQHVGIPTINTSIPRSNKNKFSLHAMKVYRRAFLTTTLDGGQ